MGPSTDLYMGPMRDCCNSSQRSDEDHKLPHERVHEYLPLWIQPVLTTFALILTFWIIPGKWKMYDTGCIRTVEKCEENTRHPTRKAWNKYLFNLLITNGKANETHSTCIKVCQFREFTVMFVCNSQIPNFIRKSIYEGFKVNLPQTTKFNY